MAGYCRHHFRYFLRPIDMSPKGDTIHPYRNRHSLFWELANSLRLAPGLAKAAQLKGFANRGRVQEACQVAAEERGGLSLGQPPEAT